MDCLVCNEDDLMTKLNCDNIHLVRDGVITFIAFTVVKLI
jgi:hypothetical protein